MVIQLERALDTIGQLRAGWGPLKSVPGSDNLVLYCRSCLWYECSPISWLQKATIDTPMKDGKFDSESVPVGASVWITVTNPSSPLHGRPIQITKRPDNLFALTGGGGQASDARRHMVLTGKPKKTKRDVELEGEIKDAESYNEPLRTARRRLTDESRRELRIASDNMLVAMGIQKVDSQKLLEHKTEVQNYVTDALGDGAQAKRITDVIMRQAVAAERGVREKSSTRSTVTGIEG